MPTLIETTALAISSETRFITLISGLIAGPAVSLNGSPTVSPMTVASWASRALAAVVAVLDQLLGVVPGTTGVGQEDRHQGAGADRAGQEAGQRADAEAEADGDRREHRQQARRGQLAQRVLGDDVDDLAVLRTAGALHDPGDLAELAAHLVDHGTGGAADGVDGQAGEEEHHRRAEQQADQDGRVEDEEVEPA